MKLICMAPDGEHITEGYFDSIEEAWGRSEDMGSRWFFYPVHIVCNDDMTIAACPEGLVGEWVGVPLSALSESFAMYPEIAMDYTSGSCNYGIHP